MVVKAKPRNKFEIEVFNKTRLKISKILIRNILSKTLAYFNWARPVALAVLIVGRRRIVNLNRKWRGKNEAANVLSFPQFEKEVIKKYLNFGSGSRKKSSSGNFINGVLGLGEIVIYSGAIVDNKNPKAINSFFLAHLLIHGFLHLVGFSHQKESEFRKMARVEKFLLKDYF